MKNVIAIMTMMVILLLAACGQEGAEVEVLLEPDLEAVEVTEGPDTDLIEDAGDQADVLDADGENAAEALVEEVDESLEEEDEINEEAILLTAEDYEGLGVNEQGHIMVVMYHGILDNPPYHRTKEDFIKDLTFMYDHNYRLISMSDYLKGYVDVEAGMTPIVLTFDDGLASTFSLIQTDEGLDVDPESAIGIMEAFAQDHPDFGKDASLYIHGNDWNFRGEGTAEERLTWLVDHGYELGNHSNTHANFKSLSEAGLKEELGEVDLYVASVLPEYKLVGITYPFGARPSEGLRPLIEAFTYQGLDVSYDVAFREGPSGTFYAPVHVKFSPYNAPRVRGSEGEVQDMWWFFDHFESNSNQKFISDGRPETLVVPLGKEGNIAPVMSGMYEIITY